MDKLKIDDSKFKAGYNDGQAKIKRARNIHCSAPPCSVAMAETVLYTAMLNAALDHYDPDGQAPFTEPDTLGLWLMQEDVETIVRRTNKRLAKMGYSISQNSREQARNDSGVA